MAMTASEKQAAYLARRDKQEMAEYRRVESALEVTARLYGMEKPKRIDRASEG